MKTARLVCLAALPFCAAAALPAHSQMPTDNDAWKHRCEVLRDADPNGRGTVPAWLTKAPGTVPGPRWTTFGWDRSRANQPYVACTFFYLGAIADHNRNKGHADHVHAHESAVMGRIEDKLARHEDVTTREKLTRTHAEAAEIPKPALTIPEEEAMVTAATTMPLDPNVAASSQVDQSKPSPLVPRKHR